VETKRKLPVVPSQATEEQPSRSQFQWVGFGVVAIFVVWLPVAWVTDRLAVRVSRGWVGAVGSLGDASQAVARLDEAARLRLTLTLVAFHAGGLALACFAGGLLVGRWGGQAGVREAAIAGAAAVVIVTLFALATTGPMEAPWPLLLAVALATGASALGGRLGHVRRPKP
jgi:tRNA-(ms[2]io[6]A)-hydroxylase